MYCLWKGKIVWKILISLLLLFMIGCSSVPITSSNDDSSNGVPELPLQRIVVADFMFTALSISFVLGVIGTGLGFGKIGLSIIGGSLAGIILRTTILTYVSNVYFSIAVALIVLSGVLLIVAGVLMKNKAIKEMILSIQHIKDWAEVEGSDRKEANDIMNSLQSKETKQTVQKVKSDLKVKGKI